MNMDYTCANCHLTVGVARHTKAYIRGGCQIVLVMGTGKNMCYRGDLNREYAICPKCGVVESQQSAEARDQQDNAMPRSKSHHKKES
jgi:ribosomal protein S27AE